MASEKIELRIDVEHDSVDAVLKKLNDLNKRLAELGEVSKKLDLLSEKAVSTLTIASSTTNKLIQQLKGLNQSKPDSLIKDAPGTINGLQRLDKLLSSINTELDEIGGSKAFDSIGKQGESTLNKLKRQLMELKQARREALTPAEAVAKNPEIDALTQQIRQIEGKQVKIPFKIEQVGDVSAEKIIPALTKEALEDSKLLTQETRNRLNAVKDLNLSYIKGLKLRQQILIEAKENALTEREMIPYSRELAKVNREIQVASGDMKTNWEKAGTVIKNTALAMAAFQAIRTLGGAFQAGVDTALQTEQFTVTLGTLMGNTIEAKKRIGELYQFVAQTPLKMPEVQAATQTLLSFGIASEDVIPSLRKLGDLARGEEETFKGLALIYGQAKATGRIMTQDLNQFANRGVPLIEEFSKMFNKSGEEIRKMAEAGQLTFPILDQALNNLTGTGGKFENMMLKASQTTAGRLSTLEDNFNLTMGKIISLFLPVANAFITFASNLLEGILSIRVAFSQLTFFISENRVAFGLLAGAVTTLALPAISALVSQMYALISAYVSLTVAQTASIIKTRLWGSVVSIVTTAVQAWRTALMVQTASLVFLESRLLASTKAIGAFIQSIWASRVALASALGVIGLVSTALYLLYQAFIATSSAQANLNKVSAQALELYRDEAVEAKKLFDVLMSSVSSYNEKAKALEDINKLYSSYIPFILNEASSYDLVAVALEEVNQKLKTKALLTLRANAMEEFTRQQLEATQKAYTASIEANLSVEEARQNARAVSDQFEKTRQKADAQVIRGRIEDAEEEIKAVTAIQNQLLNKQKDRAKIEQGFRDEKLKAEKTLRLEEQKLRVAKTKEEKDAIQREINIAKEAVRFNTKAQSVVEQSLDVSTATKRIKQLQGVIKESTPILKEVEKNIKANVAVAADEVNRTFGDKVASGLYSVVGGAFNPFLDASEQLGNRLNVIEGDAQDAGKSLLLTGEALNILSERVNFDTVAQKENTKAVQAGTKAKADYVKILDLEIKRIEASLKPMQDFAHQLRKDALEALKELDRIFASDEEMVELPVRVQLEQDMVEAAKRELDAINKLQEDYAKAKLDLENKVSDAMEEIQEARMQGDFERVKDLQVKYKNYLNKNNVQSLLVQIEKNKNEEMFKIRETNFEQEFQATVKFQNRMRLELEKYIKDTTEKVRDAQVNRTRQLLSFQNSMLSTIEFRDPEANAIITSNTYKIAEAEFKLAQLRAGRALIEAQRNLNATRQVTDQIRVSTAEIERTVANAESELNRLEALNQLPANQADPRFQAQLGAQRDYVAKSKRNLELQQGALRAQETALSASSLEVDQKTLDVLKAQNDELEAQATLRENIFKDQIANLEEVQRVQNRDLDANLTARKNRETSIMGVADVVARPFARTDEGQKRLKEISDIEDKIFLVKKQKDERYLSWLAKSQEKQNMIIELNMMKREALANPDDENLKKQIAIQEKSIENIDNQINTEIELWKGEQKELDNLETEKSKKQNEYQIERKLKAREEVLQTISIIEEASRQVLGFFNSMYQAQIQMTDKLIEAQAEKVERAREVALRSQELGLKSQERGAAEQLQLEEERLEKLKRQRESFIEDQKNLATIELAINTAITVARAAAEGGGIASVATIALALGALVAGLATARSIANSQTFSKGGHTGSKEDPKLVPYGGKGSVGIVHKNEYVMDEKTVNRYRPYLEQIHRGSLDLIEELQWAEEGRKAKSLMRGISKNSKTKSLKTSSLKLNTLETVVASQAKPDVKTEIITLQNQQMAKQLETLSVKVEEVTKAIKEQESMRVNIDENGVGIIARQVIERDNRIRQRNS